MVNWKNATKATKELSYRIEVLPQGEHFLVLQRPL